MKRCISLTVCLLALLLLLTPQGIGAPAAADDAKDKDQDAKPAETPESKPAAPAKPSVLTVKRAPLKIEVSLDGIFEAQKTTELLLRPNAWATMKVLSAVEHGTVVKQGDLLVALETEKIDLAIADLRAELQASEIGLKTTLQQLQSAEKTTPMDLAAVERAHDYAVEAAEYYFKVSRPLDLRSAEFSLKSAEQYLEIQQEDLDQLEKMYKADDLTEETEEIILKRARNALERAKFSFEQAELRHKRTLGVTIPREDQSVKNTRQRAEIAYRDALVTIPATLAKLRLDVAKTKITLARSKEKLEDLLADRATMTVKAPAGGVVYHGKATRGKFSAGSSSSSLRKAATLTANSVFMTLVKPRPMAIRATVPEKELYRVQAGIQGIAVPAAFPEMKLTAIVGRVATVPMIAGGFDTELSVALNQEAEALMPGMTCKVKLVAYENDDAIAVPAKAVAAEDSNGRKQYVHVVGKDEKSAKRYVTVGQRTADKVEITKGLKEGEKILSVCPKDE